ncbi:hypothetical protein [Streptomyces sp. G45]
MSDSIIEAVSSEGGDLFDQFGILRDDYTPKPAFTVYRRLIGELGAMALP